MTSTMSLKFPEHDDVVFKRAPLSEVLCHIEFPSILALSDISGVTGFQDALRSDYPKLDYESAVDVALSEDSDELPQPLPIWKLQDNATHWTVSIGLNFIALSTVKYSHFNEFSARLSKTLQALERTIAPSSFSWIGLRKTNQLRHPNVTEPQGWFNLIRSELLSFYGSKAMTNQTFKDATFHAKFHIHDNENGILTISHGINEEDPTSYMLDLDYMTNEPLSMDTSEAIVAKLKTYSDSITGCFHWCLKKDMAKYLDPIPRNEATDGER